MELDEGAVCMNDIRVLKPGDWQYMQGTHLVGYLYTTKENIVRKLGTPEQILDEKVHYEWKVMRRVGTQTVIASIYDWQEPVPARIKKWHIGGENIQALKLIRELFPRSKVRAYGRI